MLWRKVNREKHIERVWWDGIRGVAVTLRGVGGHLSEHLRLLNADLNEGRV